MKHHTLPRYAVCKNRDYVLAEASFLSEMGSSYRFLSGIPGLPEELKQLLLDVADELEARRIENLVKLRERARRYAWKFTGNSHEGMCVTILLQLSSLEMLFFARAKNPDVFELALRENRQLTAEERATLGID